MAYQSVQGVMVPEIVSQYTMASLLLDADGEKYAAIFRVPKTGTLGKVGFRTGTVTTGDTLKVSFQDVSAVTGDPDGGVDQYRTIVIGDGDDQTWHLTGLLTNNGTDGGAKRAVTKGDWLVVVWEFDSYVAGNLNLIKQLAGSKDFTFLYQYYHDYYTAAAWAKQTTGAPLLALLYDDDSLAYIPSVLPATTIVGTTYNSGSTPDEIALYFSNPFPCKVEGAWAYADLDGDGDLVLYDVDGTSVLGTINCDKDVRVSTSRGIMVGMFPSEITLAKDTNYRLALKPTSVTGLTIMWWEVDQASYLAQAAGGTAYHWSERTDAGAWGQTTTKRPFMGLIISALDDGTGGGGGGMIVHPGMTGGING